MSVPYLQVLRTTNRRYQEKREIVASHVHTEQVLTSQAQQLKTAADLASQDTYLLHDTLERRKLTDRNIVSVTENFEKSMHTNITDIASGFDNFHSQIDNQSKNFVEYVGEYLGSAFSRTPNFERNKKKNLRYRKQYGEKC